MRDEDHGGVQRLQHRLEPLERLDVEVVRRLVEQQQVGLRRERARERRARQLAAREGRERPVEVGIGEAEPAHDRRPPGRASRSRPRARAAPALPSSGAASPASWSPAAIAVSSVRSSSSTAARSAVPGEHVLAQRARAQRGRPLVVKRDPRSLLQRELAAVDRDLACQLAQQRRLAGAVRPREREPVLALDLERHAVEQDFAGMLLAE